MLVHSKEGKLCLEDLDGVVELDFSQLVGSPKVLLQQAVEKVEFFLRDNRTNPAKDFLLRDLLRSWRATTQITLR
jgi:hypothetical protein